jgi:uncharacterized membrane protein YfcA
LTGGAILAGLWLGTDLGARMANGVDKAALRRILILFPSLMTLSMAFKAIGRRAAVLRQHH